ncbi:MAG: hypothetical protein ACTIAG_01560 [Lactobacillus sp.]|nr:hypothetical protein [Lactobacillus sp.]MDN6052999.1 hypothetical protein [Lactobacillus sp.]
MTENSKKTITLNFDQADSSLGMDFSDNLTDGREIGYILGAAFFAFNAEQGLTKEALKQLVDEQYDAFGAAQASDEN